MGSHWEAYDAELEAVARGLRHLVAAEGGVSFTVFTNSLVAMKRIRSDLPGPGRDVAIRIIQLATSLYDQSDTLTIRWVPGNSGVEGNELVDQYAGQTAEFGDGIRRQTTDRVSPSHLKRTATQREVQE